MEKINLNLDKSKKYVIACSFGPDSMALLHMAIQEKLNIVVAHVNYMKRDVSTQEQKRLDKFCRKRNIRFFCMVLLNAKPKGNFQDWAREVRYKFFKRVADEAEADAVLVAHQEDDLIETYLMQKIRGSVVKNPGISQEISLFGVKIIRPLLMFTKKELTEYDIANNVPFSIDASNLEDDYERNRIRHGIVEKLTREDRDLILEEIRNIKNEEVECKTRFYKSEFLCLQYEQFVKLLDYYMQIVGEHRNLSRNFFQEILDVFSDKPTHRFEITESIGLEVAYDEVLIVNLKKLKSFEYEFTYYFKNEFLEIDFTEGAEDRGIKAEPPYMVKNCEKGDLLTINCYDSQVRRLFIDWKVPLYLREVWPKICDQNGAILYIPRYRKNFEDNHQSLFKIDTDYFVNFD